MARNILLTALALILLLVGTQSPVVAQQGDLTQKQVLDAIEEGREHEKTQVGLRLATSSGEPEYVDEVGVLLISQDRLEG